ncbi:endonuclease/exonuclease/phosphatase family protein [Candidatus Liberibacter africanus]|nr:endonuclease/exonuclease/phosphatase family protein [Candidatus Liberibacter africanus]
MIKYFLFFTFFLIPYTSFAQKMRVASWNINTLSEKEGVNIWRNSVIREKSDYDLLRQYAMNLNADIVSLQEMGSYGAVAKIFPEDTWQIFYSGEDSIWSSILNYFNIKYNSRNSSINTAVVVRKKSMHVLQVSYPFVGIENSHSRAGKRRAVELLIEINGQKVWILDIHLKSFCFLNKLENTRNSSCNLLNKQSKWLKLWIDQKKETGIPFIIAGDFNRKINYLEDKDSFWQK